MMPPEKNDDLGLEIDLRQALRRIEPERDFSAISYADKTPRRRMDWWPPSRSVLAMAAAVFLMVLLPVGVTQYRAREQRREEAGAQLIRALQITENKLQKTRQMVVRQLDRRNVL